MGFEVEAKVQKETSNRRVAYVKAHLLHVEACIQNLERGKGSASGSLLELSSHAMAMAVVQWFECRDLMSARKWFYTEARLTRKYLNIDRPSSVTLAHVWQLLPSLMSGGGDVISWDKKFTESCRSASVFFDQATAVLFGCAYAALCGDISAVEECVSRADSSLTFDARYRSDIDFFRQFASGEISRMAAGIEAVADRSQAKDRLNDECGYTRGLISTPACVYALIARYAGHNVEVAHDLVPMEWMSNGGGEISLPAGYGFLGEAVESFRGVA